MILLGILSAIAYVVGYKWPEIRRIRVSGGSAYLVVKGPGRPQVVGKRLVRP